MLNCQGSNGKTGISDKKLNSQPRTKGYNRDERRKTRGKRMPIDNYKDESHSSVTLLRERQSEDENNMRKKNQS